MGRDALILVLLAGALFFVYAQVFGGSTVDTGDDSGSDDSFDDDLAFLDDTGDGDSSPVATTPGMPTSLLPAVNVWGNAVATLEGYFKQGTRPNRNNNPEDLEITGDLGKDGPFAVFSSPSAGWQAMLSDLEAKVHKYPNATILDITNRMAPSSDGNNPNSYANSVVKALQQFWPSVTTSTTMSQLGGLG